MATNDNEVTETEEADVKSDELEVEILDDVDAVDEKTELETALEEIEDGNTTIVESAEELEASLEGKDDEVEVEAEVKDDAPAEESEEVVEETETKDDDELEVEIKDDEELEVEVKDEIDEALEALLESDDIKVKHLAALGVADEVGEDEFLCGIERKMLKGEPCSHCRGGCAPEGEQKELPGLLDIELKVLDQYGTVLKSGYVPEKDLFILDVARKSDDKVIEVAYSGEGEELGWHLLNQNLVEGKDALGGQKVVSTETAAEVAVKELGGEAKGVEGAVFEGFDAYVVQVETPSGKSYDAYVRLDGELIGYDEFVLDGEEKAMPEGEEPSARGLAAKVSAIEDVDTLKAVLTAVADDADEVPEDVKMALIKAAMKFKVEDLLPEGWMDAEAAPEAPVPAAPAAAPAPPAVVTEEVKKKALIDGEEDNDFLASLEEFQSLTKDDDSE